MLWHGLQGKGEGVLPTCSGNRLPPEWGVTGLNRRSPFFPATCPSSPSHCASIVDSATFFPSLLPRSEPGEGRRQPGRRVRIALIIWDQTGLSPSVPGPPLSPGATGPQQVLICCHWSQAERSSPLHRVRLVSQGAPWDRCSALSGTRGAGGQCCSN